MAYTHHSLGIWLPGMHRSGGYTCVIQSDGLRQTGRTVALPCASRLEEPLAVAAPQDVQSAVEVFRSFLGHVPLGGNLRLDPELAYISLLALGQYFLNPLSKKMDELSKYSWQMWTAVIWSQQSRVFTEWCSWPYFLPYSCLHNCAQVCTDKHWAEGSDFSHHQLTS